MSRPQQRSASSAAFVQRVWYGPHGSKSKLPAVVAKDVPAIAPETHDGLTSSPNEAGGAKHADTTSFYVEPLTRLMRERWQAREFVFSLSFL